MVFERYKTRFKAGEKLSEFIKAKDIELFNFIKENPELFKIVANIPKNIFQRN